MADCVVRNAGIHFLKGLEIKVITNKQVKELVTWNRKSKARKEDGVFLVEGSKMFLEAPNERIRNIYVSESFFAEDE